jgi:NAD(P)H-hydrate epimerase
MQVVKASEMKALDEWFIKEVGVPAEMLMERAGLSVAEAIFEAYPVETYGSVLVVCGPGNNGGDGMVCARHLVNLGYEVEVVLLAEKETYQGEALTNLKVLENLGFMPEEVGYIVEFRKVLYDFSPEIIVDAIFGTGLKRPIEGNLAAIVEEINLYRENRGCKVVAVDMPSGVCADTGEVLGTAVKADLTVTFELPKLGQFFYPGKEYVGRLKVCPIGFFKPLLEKRAPKRYLIDLEWAKKVFRPRKGYTHKGLFGHLLVLAGSKGKSGAGLLSALGGLRAGAGLVTLASTRSLQPVYASMLPEALTAGLEEGPRGEVSYANLESLLDLCEKKTALVVGPGLGLGEEVKRLFWELLERVKVPVLIDADGLTIASEKPERLKELPCPKVLTPHPGEAERLLKISKREILRDPVTAAKKLVDLTGAVVVLKGPHTVISSTDGREGISVWDVPGLSQGGTGDVLSGVIGALMSQRYDLFEAACLGVFLHGWAGEKLASEKGPFGYLASEVANKIPEVLKEICDDRP